MKTAARSLSAAPIALAAALLTAFLVLVAPLSASAHDSLLTSSPEADSTVDTLPTELTLTFSAKLIDGEGATEVVVTDPSGASVTDGPATVNGAIVTQPLVGEGPAGEYEVTWKIVSSDGHPTSKKFSFTVANDSAGTGATPTAGPTTEPSEPATTASPATAAPSPSATPTAEESSPASTWIWILAITGVLIAAAAGVVLASRKGRTSSPGDPAAGDSDESTER